VQKNKKSKKWTTFSAFATVPLVLVLGNSMLVPILPELAKKMNITELQSSMVITIFSVCAGIFIPFIGYIADRVKRKAVIVPALAVYGAAGILAGFGAIWGSFTTLMIARAIQGIAAAGTAPIAMALVGDMYKDGEESEALGLIEASNGFGKVISPILGSLLSLWVWYIPFFAFPIFCAGALVAVLFLIKEPPHEEKPTPIREYLKQMKSIYAEKGKWLITAYITGALGLFILFGVLVFLSDMLEKPPYSINGVAKGGILAIPLLGLVITSYTTGKVISKKGHLMQKLIIAGLVIITASLLAASFTHKSLFALIAFITAGSVGTGLILPCLNTMITGSVEKSHRGMVTSLYNCLRFLGVAAGPPLFSWLSDKSVTLLFILLAILAAGAFFAVFKLIHPPAKQPA